MSMRGIEQLGSSFGSIFLFPYENSWGEGVGGWWVMRRAHTSWEKTLVPGPR